MILPSYIVKFCSITLFKIIFKGNKWKEVKYQICAQPAINDFEADPIYKAKQTNHLVMFLFQTSQAY